MVDCIKDVNQVLQIPATTTRILLNHFKWDKDKLMERYYYFVMAPDLFVY